MHVTRNRAGLLDGRFAEGQGSRRNVAIGAAGIESLSLEKAR
jgi:hypothetical protein